MTEPLWLVEPSLVSGILRVNPVALSLLRRLVGRLHVVAIFGPKDTGKSFLMNQLAGEGEGFRCAPGIWLRCLPHPVKPGDILVLLDTEGLPEEMEEDAKTTFLKLFLLDVLLSSVFIYNTTGEGDIQKELDKLIYVTELSDTVRVLEDCSSENSFLLDSFLPEFVWCLHNVPSDSCWEDMLQATDNDMDTILSSSEALKDTPTSCIQTFFPSQKAFCFRSPYVDEEEGEIFSVGDLHPVFQKQLGSVKEYIFSRNPKSSLGNTFASGEVLSSLLERFVNSLSQDEPIVLNSIGDDPGAVFAREEGCESFKELVTRPPREAPREIEIPRTSQLPPQQYEEEGCESFKEHVKKPPREAPREIEIPRTSQLPPQEYEAPLPLPSPSCTASSTAQTISMEEPVCLIENKRGEQLHVNQEALRLLQKIQQPVVVVAIVGLYRTGKSYLMNKLAGKVKGGFSLGATVQANTKGIWMWCRPHPRKPGHTLVLLDTEGLGDVEKSNTKNDTWIFALSVLLSSTFIYNSMNTIDNYALSSLHYVTELTKHIKVKSSASQSCQNDDMPDDFAWFFPAFIWVVRDFTLQLVVNGSPITEDQYLENALKRKTDASEEQDHTKKYLRLYFPDRKCFVFDRPASRRDLEHLEDLPESKLSPDFVEQANCFCSYVYEKAEPKVIHGTRVATGLSLGSLVETYVNAIRSGTVPCIENAVVALAKIENSAAVHDALKRYEEMVEHVAWSALPSESTEELLKIHAVCEEEAIQVFMARVFKDEDHEHQKQLGKQLHLKLEELCHRNEQASLDRCQAVLLELSEEMEEKICNGSYSVPGGYQQFLGDQEKMEEQYRLAPDKGLMASQALQEFLRSKGTTAQAILQADRTLTDQQKRIEVERVRAEASEQEAKLQRQMREQAEQMAREMERSHREHKQQLVAKMEADQRRLMAQHETMLNQKLQEQRRLQEEGFQQEVARLENEIRNLRQQRSQMSKPRGILDVCVIS